ncbi:MAG: hypothetical protein ABI569_09385 [Casimicrobiaceae bacterium]
MTRSHRCLVAWIGILGIAFAHVAVTAQACVLRASVDRAPAMVALQAHADHCAGANQGAVPATPQGNTCEVQCTDGAPSVAAPDLPPVALSTLPLPPAVLVVAVDARAWDLSVLAATSAGPPPLLQYCRLLN